MRLKRLTVKAPACYEMLRRASDLDGFFSRIQEMENMQDLNKDLGSG
jgi:hypothetical protein